VLRLIRLMGLMRCNRPGLHRLRQAIHRRLRNRSRLVAGQL